MCVTCFTGTSFFFILFSFRPYLLPFPILFAYTCGHKTVQTPMEYRISSVIRWEFFFSFQNNPKDLDPSYDGSRSLGLFRKGKIGIIAKFHRTDLVI